MFCKKCGKQLNENAKFCTNCGQMITTIPKKEEADSIIEPIAPPEPKAEMEDATTILDVPAPVEQKKEPVIEEISEPTKIMARIDEKNIAPTKIMQKVTEPVITAEANDIFSSEEKKAAFNDNRNAEPPKPVITDLKPDNVALVTPILPSEAPIEPPAPKQVTAPAPTPKIEKEEKPKKKSAAPIIIIIILVLLIILGVGGFVGYKMLSVYPYINYSNLKFDGFNQNADFIVEDIFDYDSFMSDFGISSSNKEKVMKAIDIECSKDNDVSNGDTVTIEIDIDYDRLNSLADKPILPLPIMSKNVTVNNLIDGAAFDPFVIIESVSDYEGESIIDYKSSTFTYSDYEFVFNTDDQEGLKISTKDGSVIDVITFDVKSNGTTATVTAQFDNNKLKKEGLYIQSTTKDFEVLESNVLKGENASEIKNLEIMKDRATAGIQKVDENASFSKTVMFASKKSNPNKNLYAFIYAVPVTSSGKSEYQYTYVAYEDVYVNENNYIVGAATMLYNIHSQMFVSDTEIIKHLEEDGYKVSTYNMVKQ